MESWYIALAYLRTRPIALVSLVGVFLGLGSIVVVDAVMNGFLSIQRQMVRGTHADVAITVPAELRTDRAAVERLLEVVRSTDGVEHASRRVQSVAMFRKWKGQDLSQMRGFGGFHFVELVGIDEPDERKVTRLPQFIGDSILKVSRPEDPFWFDPFDPWWQERVPEKYRLLPLVPALIGEGLVEVMNLSVGDVLTMSTWSDRPGPDGRYGAKSRPFVVVGAFRCQDLEIDYTRAFVPREAMLDWGLENEARDLVVAAGNGQSEDEVCARLRNALAPLGVSSGAVQTWAERKVVLLRAVENERAVMNIVLFFVVIVAAFNLLVTLYMMVSEKVRDIGVLRSMGASATSTARLFFICGFLVTSLGLLLGLVGGLALTWYINPVHDFITSLTGLRLFDEEFYVFDRIPTEIDYPRIAWFAVSALLCTLFFTVFPSLRAAHQNPVEALRRG